jgi:hypothetical protein
MPRNSSAKGAAARHSLALSEGESAGVRGRCKALREIGRLFKTDHAVIIPLTVREILDEQTARKLA